MKLDWKTIIAELLKLIITILGAGAGSYAAMSSL